MIAPPLVERKVQTGLKPGMEHKLRLAIAGVLTFTLQGENPQGEPTCELRTGLESTRLESNRDEWV